MSVFIHSVGDEAAPHFSGRSLYDSKFYAFAISSGEWIQLQPTGYCPKGRRSHVACKIILSIALLSNPIQLTYICWVFLPCSVVHLMIYVVTDKLIPYS